MILKSQKGQEIPESRILFKKKYPSQDLFRCTLALTHIKLKFASVNNFLLLFRSQKTVKMSSRKTAGRRGTTKKRAQRATSNVFAMFNQDQIQEFKEAFNMIDQNRDGFIDKEDLHDVRIYLIKCFYSLLSRLTLQNTVLSNKCQALF